MSVSRTKFYLDKQNSSGWRVLGPCRLHRRGSDLAEGSASCCSPSRSSRSTCSPICLIAWMASASRSGSTRTPREAKFWQGRAHQPAPLDRGRSAPSSATSIARLADIEVYYTSRNHAPRRRNRQPALRRQAETGRNYHAMGWTRLRDRDHRHLDGRMGAEHLDPCPATANPIENGMVGHGREG